MEKADIAIDTDVTKPYMKESALPFKSNPIK